MPYYKFARNDIFYNSIKAHPQCDFYVYDSVVYYNSRPLVAGMSASNVPMGGVGHISLYEMNVDRNSALHTYNPGNDVTNMGTAGAADASDLSQDSGVKALVFPFLTKEGSLTSFRTVTTSQFNSDFAYGNIVTGSYPLTATITREYFAADSQRRHISGGLVNTLNHYKYLSPHYAYSSSAPPGCDKSTQQLSLFHLPSIFYGSSIKRRSVYLNFYITGTLTAQLHDLNGNGELIEVTGTNANSSNAVGGVVMYNEGFIILTGSWNLQENSITEKYEGTSVSAKAPKWVYFGAGANDGLAQSSIPSSSFSLHFKGTTYTPTVTMFAHAKKELNFSNNPTFLDFKSGSAAGGASLIEDGGYFEPKKRAIKNTTTSSYVSGTAPFKRQVFISKIGIYDKNKNLIAITKLASPIRKREEDDLTFKLKLDI
tara:strand:- start:238 stop:1518 length:1281 start_codon:yes stop_codon:yes gene_type:complete